MLKAIGSDITMYTFLPGRYRGRSGGAGLVMTSLYPVLPQVVGMGEEWRGGDVARWPGGGQKVNLLRPVLEEWRESSDVIVMFVDSYDVIFTAGEADILAKFQDFNSRVVFSAEPFCWPDSSLVVSTAPPSALVEEQLVKLVNTSH